MKFSQIIRGTRARKTVTVEGIEGPDGALLPIDVRPLNGMEQADVLARARAFAEGKGVKEPRDGEPIYELGKQVHTLLLGCLDHDSPTDKPTPFFANAEEILDGLDRDRRSYLYELQEAWEDQCAPRPSAMEAKDFMQWCMDVCAANEGDDGPFVQLRPVLRWSCVRTLAAIHVLSQTHRSGSGSPSESASTTTTSPSPTPE